MLLLQWVAERSESQETVSIGPGQCGWGPEWEQWLLAYSRSTAHINVHEWAFRVSQIPRWVTTITMSNEWDLFSTYGKVRPGFTYTCGSFQSAYSIGEEIRAYSSGEGTMSFVRGWNNLWQISNLSNQRRKRLQVSSPYGTPLKTSSMLEGDVPQEQRTNTQNKFLFFSFKKVSENWGTLIGWQNRNTKSGLIGGSTSLWRTMTAPVKNEDDGDQDRASLTCDQRMVPLGGHGDSRASLTCDQQACGHLLDTQH